MQLSLLFACLWVVIACVTAMVPSKKNHWPQAYVLIAVGIPVLIWVYAEAGLPYAALAFGAGASVLRWPLRYLARWIRRQLGKDVAP